MLKHPTLEKLYQLRLHGMAKAFREQMEQPETDGLPFTDRLALEIMDDRHINRSTLITSQLPVENWHAMIGDGTLADAILDRLVHNAHKIKMKGESMRRRMATIKDPSTETKT